jgi:hypothetical protein
MALLTPKVNGKRVRMQVSQADSDKVTRGPGCKGTVTDKKTGKKYRVYGASCGMPHCYCDATAHLIKKALR